jgi:RNA polymerase sigma factor for flagellar operon FliA
LETTADKAPKYPRGQDGPRPESHGPLWAAYRAGPCDDTRNTLVEAYQGLVAEVVRRFAARLPRSVDRGDLHTAGSVGLISAVEGFDPTRGVRFESYCELRVKGALLDELRAQDWLPRPWRQRIELQKRTSEALRGALGRNPSDEEVAEAMELPIETYRQVFGTGLPNAPTGSMPMDEGDDDLAPVLDVVPDTNIEAPGDKLTRDELLQLVAQRLTEQEYRIVYLKYWEELPMREIGQLTNLSESRVCKIHARLLDRLRDRFRVDHL